MLGIGRILTDLRRSEPRRGSKQGDFMLLIGSGDIIHTHGCSVVTGKKMLVGAFLLALTPQPKEAEIIQEISWTDLLIMRAEWWVGLICCLGLAYSQPSYDGTIRCDGGRYLILLYKYSYLHLEYLLKFIYLFILDFSYVMY